MKRQLLILMAAASMLLTGCAGTTVRSNVTAFHEWPAETQEKSFVFARSKEHENNLEYRSYENLVRAELQNLGFIEAATANAAKLKVSLSYNVSERDVRVIEPVYVDPFWYGPPPYYYHRWHGYYHRFYDPFWYGPTRIEYRDNSFQVFHRQLKVSIARVADSKNIYDVTVDSEGQIASLAAVMPYMVRSAFTDFPGKSGVARRVDIKTQG